MDGKDSKQAENSVESFVGKSDDEPQQSAPEGDEKASKKNATEILEDRQEQRAEGDAKCATVKGAKGDLKTNDLKKTCDQSTQSMKSDGVTTDDDYDEGKVIAKCQSCSSHKPGIYCFICGNPI